MGNCLVTKLKSIVNNDNLEEFGKISAIFSIGSNGVFGSNEALLLKIKGGTYKGQTEYSSAWFLFTDTDNLVSDGTYGENKIKIVGDKYKAAAIEWPSWINAESLIGSNVTTFWIMTGTLKNSSCLEKFVLQNSVTSLNFSYTDFDEVVNVNNFGINGAITTITMSRNPNFIGSLDKLGMSPVTNIQLPWTEKVTFTIENFVTYNVNATRTSGTTSVARCHECKVYWKDNRFSTSGNFNIAWEPIDTNTKITFNSQETVIHVNSNNTWTRVS